MQWKLTDYLEGDHYFKIHREGHNLDRCRTQFKLVKDIEEKLQQMKDIVMLKLLDDFLNEEELLKKYDL